MKPGKKKTGHETGAKARAPSAPPKKHRNTRRKKRRSKSQTAMGAEYWLSTRRIGRRLRLRRQVEDAKALHAAGIGIDDFKRHPAGVAQHFAARRHAAGKGEHKAAKRVDLVAFLLAQEFTDMALE